MIKWWSKKKMQECRLRAVDCESLLTHDTQQEDTEHWHLSLVASWSSGDSKQWDWAQPGLHVFAGLSKPATGSSLILPISQLVINDLKALVGSNVYPPDERMSVPDTSYPNLSWITTFHSRNTRLQTSPLIERGHVCAQIPLINIQLSHGWGLDLKSIFLYNRDVIYSNVHKYEKI